MIKSKKFWDKIAPRYAKSPIKDEKSYHKKLDLTQKYFQPDWRVLEFGCGTGSTALLHAPYVQHIIATDISQKILDIAKKKTLDANISNISFQQGTLETLDLETESFDAILGLNILHLLEDVQGAISGVHSLLKPGGLFISSTALIGEMQVYWRILIPLMQLLGMAPYVNSFGKNELAEWLENSGFDIDYEWQPKRGSVFIVAKRN